MFWRNHSVRENPRAVMNPFLKYLVTAIRLRGPMTVAQYMNEALLNPIYGYYMKRDVFGKSGDFITAPEISQVFGELLGIWVVLNWERMGRPPRFNLIEFGPGRGTLMADMLRTLHGVAQFRASGAVVQAHLIEASIALREVQRKTLGVQISTPAVEPGGSGPCRFGGTVVRWCAQLSDVGTDVPAVIVANEYLDALPIHQFRRTDAGWREVLVEAAGPNGPDGTESVSAARPPLQFVLAKLSTPAAVAYLHNKDLVPSLDTLETPSLELCPSAFAAAQAMGAHVAASGGAGLLIDYGEDGPIADSLVGFQRHRQVHPLHDPGECDLTAHVDFSAVNRALAKTCQTFAPVTQSQLLLALGLQARAERLMRSAATPQQAEQHRTACHRLVDPQQMGVRYKAVAFVPRGTPPPVFDRPLA